MKPISVILPVHNAFPYLEASVSSVLAQSLRDFEFLIVDDASTDGSLAWLEQINDDRVRLFKNEKNKGLFYNLNLLIKNSNAPLIKIWAQDDIMYPGCLAKIIEFHGRYPRIGFSYSGRDIIDEMGRVILLNINDVTPEIIPVKLHTRIAFFTGSIAGNISNVTLAAHAMKTVGLFNESMTICGDFDMWVRIAKNYDVGFLKEPLIQLRQHAMQLSRLEKYYINHLEEDLQVYQNLLSYTDQAETKKGKLLLRNHKLLFYYTLMAKAFLKGSLKTGYRLSRILRKFDNLWILSFYFVRNRMLFRKKYARMHVDNSEFLSPSPETREEKDNEKH